MKSPVIALCGSYFFDRNYEMEAGHKRLVVNDDYYRSLIEAGAIPYVLFPHEKAEIIKAQLDAADAVLLAGGADIDPILYHEEPHPKLSELEGERDFYESKVLEIVKKRNLPTLGICRGMQIMNAFFGGSLYQDYSLFPTDKPIRHDQEYDVTTPSHSIKIADHSRLAKALDRAGEGDFVIRVNSFHHQVIKDVAPGFKASAYAFDGVVEAIESNEHLFWAVQWHPEMMSRNNESALKIFKYFIEEVQKTL